MASANSTKSLLPLQSHHTSTYATSNPITVTSTASYYYRAINVSSGLTGNPVSRGIAFAEVVVKNSSGNIIQCSNTDAIGGISFQIDKNAGSYTIQINSRAFNSKLKASVLADPTSNSVYSISKSFSLTGSEGASTSVPAFYAYARAAESANLEGGGLSYFI